MSSLDNSVRNNLPSETELAILSSILPSTSAILDFQVAEPDVTLGSLRFPQKCRSDIHPLRTHNPHMPAVVNYS